MTLQPHDIVQAVRDHYVEQYATWVRTCRAEDERCHPELKVQLKNQDELYRGLYCFDLVVSGPKREMQELVPERQLTFAPVTGALNSMSFEITSFRWDVVSIEHDGGDLDPSCLADWFEAWFDPEDRRYQPSESLGNFIHSVVLEPGGISVDFGSATTDAFWELLTVLEAAGVRSVKIVHDTEPEGSS